MDKSYVGKKVIVQGIANPADTFVGVVSFFSDKADGTYTACISTPVWGQNLIITEKNESEYSINVVSKQEQILTDISDWSRYTLSTSSGTRIGTTSSYYKDSTTRLVGATQELVSSGTAGYKLNGIQKVGIEAQTGYKYSLTGYNEDISQIIPFNSLSDDDTEYQEFDVSTCAYINVLLAKIGNGTIPLSDYDKITVTKFKN